MGNTRRAKPGRQARVLSQKDEIRRLKAEVQYTTGYAESLQAQLAATRMERPADLDQWIEDEAIPLMDKEERDAWEAQTPEEREAFKDELGQRINTQKLLNEL